jgi:hypothetical protein
LSALETPLRKGRKKKMCQPLEVTPTLPGFEIVKPFKFSSQPYEYKITALRECPTPESMQICDTPQRAADYWRLHIPAIPHFNPECECFIALLLNTRRRVKGHRVVGAVLQNH